jgi:DNA-binding NarL/FixJ family response regulator
VLVVEDDRALRESLVGTLPRTGQIEVVGAYASAEEAIARARWGEAEVLLLDLELPGIGGIALTTWVREHHPHLRVAIHTIHDDRELVFRSIEAGAHGYVLKGEGPRAIAAQLLQLQAGEAPVSPAIATLLLQHLGPTRREGATDPLSLRETELLRLLAAGNRYKEAAVALGISVHTVKTHVSRIYEKLEAKSRPEALRRARLLGIV